MNIFNEIELSYYKSNIIFAGADEVGRGCLAGPVFGAAVVIDQNFDISLINDSKKLSSKTMESLFNKIINTCNDYSIAQLDNEVIDKYNILQASVKVIELSLLNLKTQFDVALIDGNYFHTNHFKYQTIVKGDEKCASIATASILAKVSRDRWMTNVADILYPEYFFAKHKGYATKLHFEMITKYGICPIHRKTFLQKFFDRQNTLF